MYTWRENPGKLTRSSVRPVPLMTVKWTWPAYVTRGFFAKILLADFLYIIKILSYRSLNWMIFSMVMSRLNSSSIPGQPYRKWTTRIEWQKLQKADSVLCLCTITDCSLQTRQGHKWKDSLSGWFAKLFEVAIREVSDPFRGHQERRRVLEGPAKWGQER